MAPPRQVYRGGTLFLSVLMVVIGISLLVSTLTFGGGLLTRGVLFGSLFLVAGGARLYLLRRT
ncbi:MAG: hypothetical protein ACR2ML_11685 [Solirubrobacteraceae bacterium]